MSIRNFFKYSPAWRTAYYRFVYFEIAYFGVQSLIGIFDRCSGGANGAPIACNSLGNVHLAMYTLGLLWALLIPLKIVLALFIAFRDKRPGSAISGLFFSGFSPAALTYFNAARLAVPYVYVFLSKLSLITWAALTALFLWLNQWELAQLPPAPPAAPRAADGTGVTSRRRRSL